MNENFSLRKSYLFLIVLAGLFSTFSFLAFYEGQWISGYLSDVAAGIIGSLLIIFLIDRIIERNKKKEQLRILRIALRRLRIPILWHMTLLCQIYKAVTKNKPTPLPTSFEDTFCDNYYKEISFLDFTKDAPVIPKRNWFTYLDEKTKFFKEKLEKVIDTYADSLDVELIDILEKIVNSHFFFFIPQVKNLPAIDRQLGVRRIYTAFSGMEDFVKEHVTHMLELIKYYNSYIDLPIKLRQDVWEDDVAPKWGDGRAKGRGKKIQRKKPST